MCARSTVPSTGHWLEPPETSWQCCCGDKIKVFACLGSATPSVTGRFMSERVVLEVMQWAKTKLKVSLHADL